MLIFNFTLHIIYNIGTTGNTSGCAIYKAYTNWDNWSYWCCTYDKNHASSADRLKGYIDGVDPGGWTETTTPSYNTGTITNNGSIKNTTTNRTFTNKGNITIKNKGVLTN